MLIDHSLSQIPSVRFGCPRAAEISIQFLAPARATDLIAIGRVLRRGKTLVNCDVDVVTPDGEAVAKAIAIYKVG